MRLKGLFLIALFVCLFLFVTGGAWACDPPPLGAAMVTTRTTTMTYSSSYKASGGYVMSGSYGMSRGYGMSGKAMYGAARQGPVRRLLFAPFRVFRARAGGC